MHFRKHRFALPYVKFWAVPVLGHTLLIRLNFNSTYPERGQGVRTQECPTELNFFTVCFFQHPKQGDIVSL